MKSWKTNFALMASCLMLASCAETADTDSPSGDCQFTSKQCSADGKYVESCVNGRIEREHCALGCSSGACKQSTGELCNYSGSKCSDDGQSQLTCQNGQVVSVACPNGCAYNACKPVSESGSQEVLVPKVTGLEPTSGKPGTKVTVKGANLGKVQSVFFASEMVDVESANSDSVVAVAPNLSGMVMVGVMVDGKRLSAGTFTYLAASENKAEVDWCQLTHVEPNIKPAEELKAYAQVFEDGVTGSAGSHAGLHAQVGYMKADGNASDVEAYTWVDAKRNDKFSGEAAGNNDEYMSEGVVLGTGKYRVAYRFSLDGSNWQYCDQNGSQDGFSGDNAGTVTVAEEPVPEAAKVEWCRIMNGNTTISANAGDMSEHIYAQAFVPECTHYQTHCANLKAQVGFGSPALGTTSAIADGYTWSDASLNAAYDGSGGDKHDEFMGQVKADKAGTYAVVYRMSVDNGETWTYCDTSDDVIFSVSDAMTLNVVTPGSGNETPNPDEPVVAEKKIEWCRIQAPASLAVRANQESAMVYGQVYVPGCTGMGKQCEGLQAEVGYGAKSAASAEGFTFAKASYNASASAGYNDEFMGQVKPTEAGDYAVVYRFSLDGQNWTYCDYDDAEGFNMAKAVPMSVKDTDTIVWCRTLVEGSEMSLGNAMATYGQVWVENCSEGDSKCASVVAEVGYGAEGAKAEDFKFVDAKYNEAVTTGNNDEYMAEIKPEEIGKYRVAYRFSVDNKKTWTYCDADDKAEFTADNMSSLTVKDPIEWCQLYMNSPLTVAKGIETDKLYGQAFVAGCSAKDSTKACDGLKAEIGYGVKADVNALKWQEVDYEKDVGYNDEFAGSLKLDAVGDYYVVYAFSLNGGKRKYCSMSGNKPFDMADAGVVKVIEPSANAPKVAWCQIVSEVPATMTTDAEQKVYAQAFVEGCTNAKGACENLTGYVGYGKSTDKPENFTFSSATYFKDLSNNDEFVASLKPEKVGDYQVIFAFSTDGGKTKTYCTGEDSTTFDQSKASVVKVTEPAAKTIEWCRVQHPQSTTVKQGETSEVFYGQVFVPGCSEKELKCGLIMAEVGYGTGDDMEKYTWTEAIYNEVADYTSTNNDEYGAAFAIGNDVVDTTYNVVYRFSIDNGKSWTYCDFDDANGFDVSKAAKMKVEAVKVDSSEPTPGAAFVRGVDYSCGIDNYFANMYASSGQPNTYYGQIYIPGCTEGGKCNKVVGSHFHYISIHNAQNAITSGKWLVSEAVYNDAYTGANNDEYKADVTITNSTAHKYTYAFAYSFDLKHDPSDANEKAQRVYCFIDWREYGYGSLSVE